MFTDSIKQGLTLELCHLARWADGFITAKRAEGPSPRTQAIYRQKVSAFVEWCEARNVQDAEHIFEWSTQRLAWSLQQYLPG